jgi:NAD(P)H-hydrate epimerase
MPIPIITINQMRDWERATWATGQTEAEVIRRVGQCVARHAHRLTARGDSILILAGKGHNGDDARAAVRQIENRRVDLLAVLQPQGALAEIERALKQAPALIVDGLFGVGLNRRLDGAWQKIITAVNAANLPVLAVDVPSGLNADTGEIFGAAIRANITLTVGAPKIGMFAAAAVPFGGRIEVAEDVGLTSCSQTAELNWLVKTDFHNFPPTRGVAANKGNFGHLTIIGGSKGFHGAAVLTARGAQRAQPGLVTVFVPEEIYSPVAAQLQSAMVQVWKTKISPSEKTSAILIGPGLAAPEISRPAKKITQEFWRTAKVPVVVDASALDFLGAGKLSSAAVRVITPHPGEAARLLGTTVQKVQSDRVGSLRNLSEKFGGCWVVLKGHQTLIGRSTGKIFVNSSGNPQLAQGGSGDLLAGFLAGLLAQPDLQKDLEKTLGYAVWQHGATADELSATRKNWTIEDLSDVLGNVS